MIPFHCMTLPSPCAKLSLADPHHRLCARKILPATSGSPIFNAYVLCNPLVTTFLESIVAVDLSRRQFCVISQVAGLTVGAGEGW